MKEEFSKYKEKLDKFIREFVKKHASFKTTFAGLEVGNVLIAVSTTLLMALGSLPLSLPMLLSFAVILVLMGIVGKYIDEVSDDNERLERYEEHLKELLLSRVKDEASASPHPCPPCNERLQLPCSESQEGGDRGDYAREQTSQTEN